MLLFGLGVGLCFMPLNMIIIASLPPQDAGTGAGVLQTVQRLGGSLGLAILVTVFTAAGGDQQGRTGSSAAEPLAHGVANAFVAGTVFAAVALLVALFVLRRAE